MLTSRMSERGFARAIAFLLLSAAASCGPSREPRRSKAVPVVLISVDTLRSDHLPAYGYRGVPYGIRARISSDNGATWGDIIHLRDDATTWDMGYCRMVERPDRKIVTMYYYNTPERPEQHIAATIWNPDVVQFTK